MVVSNIIKEINYNVPIKEFGEVDSEFKIKGVAINETTTSNGHRFLAEELSEATSSLNGVPLLKDHINSVDSIIGRVKTAVFDEMNKNIRFEAVINDKAVKEMVKDGRLNTVSVGAVVKDLEEAEDGALIARGIQFKELSAVAVPADMGATFGVALMEAYNISEKDNTQLKGGQITMSEEAEKTTETPEEAKEEKEAPVEAEPEAEAPEKSDEAAEVEAKFQTLMLELKKRDIAVLEKKLKESDADEKVEKEEAKEEEESDEEEEVDEAYKVVSENGFGSTSFTVVRSKY